MKKDKAMRLSWNPKKIHGLWVIVLPLIILGNISFYYTSLDQQSNLNDLFALSPKIQELLSLESRHKISSRSKKDLENKIYALCTQYHLHVISYQQHGTVLPNIEIQFRADLDTDVYALIKRIEGQKDLPCRIVSLGLFRKSQNQGLVGQLKFQVLSWS